MIVGNLLDKPKKTGTLILKDRLLADITHIKHTFNVDKKKSGSYTA